MTATIELTKTLGLIAAALTTAASAAPPSNDTCASPNTVGLGVHSGFSTVEATAEFPRDFSKCGEIFLGPDIWFRLQPSVNGLTTISTCGSNFPTNIAIYRYECEGSGPCRDCLSQIACAGFGAKSCDGAGGASLTMDLSNDWSGSDGFLFGALYVRVSGVAATDVGSVTITVTDGETNICDTSGEACNVPHKTPGCASPTCCNAVCLIDPTCCEAAWDIGCAEIATANCAPYIYFCNPDGGGPTNDCATHATAIDESGAYPFSLITARPDGPATCGMRGQSLWWRFTATQSGIASISTCRLTNFNARATVYDLGTNPDNFDFNNLSTASVACDFDDFCGNLGDQISFNAVAGRTYLARVDNEIGTPAGQGRIAVTLPWAYACSTGTVENDCAAAINGSSATLLGTEITESITLPFDMSGATMDGPFITPGDGTATAQDIWYWYRARRNGTLQVSTCGTVSAAVWLEIYGLGQTVDANDFAELPNRTVTSSLGSPVGCESTSIPVKRDDFYLVRIASIARDSFPAGAVTITVPVCEDLVATRDDGEGCGADTNGGCTTSTGFTEIALGETVSGSFAFQVAGVPQDRDWYLLSLEVGMQIEIECTSEVPAYIFLRDQLLCQQANYAVLNATSCEITTTTTSFCLPAGEHAIVVRAVNPVVGSGCDAPSYSLRAIGTSTLCASVGDDVAELPPNQISSTNPPELVPGIGVACVAEGISFATEFAKPFPELALKTSGTLEVIDFGWQHNGGTTNNALIELYDDVDGGAPVSVGVDLVLVESRVIQMWTATSGWPTVHRWKLASPRNIADFIGHPVVVLKTSASDQGFAAFAGTTAPETTPTYIRSPFCDITDFIPISSPFEDHNWTVTVWGTFGESCPADINDDGEVSAADLSLLLASWGLSGAAGDLDGDQVVGASDLSLLLGAWGVCE